MSDLNQDTINSAAVNNLPVSLSGQITVAAVVLIFALFILILVIYLRAKGYSRAIGSSSSRSRRLVFAPQEPNRSRCALDPSILASLPITLFTSKAADGDCCDECAVCICELGDGEETRVLPKCSHVFHVECIDMWFHSNNTCPLCRSPVCMPEDEVEPAVEIVIHPVTETGASSSSSSSSRKRMLVVDVPRRVGGGLLSSTGSTPLPSSRVPSSSPLPTSRLLEEVKTPTPTPTPSGFGAVRSLRRMLSRGSFKGAASCSQQNAMGMGSDLEQGKCQ